MPHSTCAAVDDGLPVIIVSPQAADSAAFSCVMVMICGVGRPSAWCLIGTSWKNASSVPEVNHSRSMPLSFIDAIIASAACSAGIEYVGSIAVPSVAHVPLRPAGWTRLLTWRAYGQGGGLAGGRGRGHSRRRINLNFGLRSQLGGPQ